MIENDTDLSRFHQIQLDILKELDRVCTANGLKYCLAYGSCLGAIRHKGFIPWDDDIDVYMLVSDFEKLQACKDSFKYPYFLQTHETDPEYGAMIGKVRNGETTLVVEGEKERDMNHGIFIDIYPLFYSPKGGWKAEKLVITSMIHRLMLYGSPPQNRGKLMKIGAQILLYGIPRKVKNWLIQYTYKIMRNQKKTEYLTSLHGDDDNVKYPKSWILPFHRVPFEGLDFPVPANSHEYLKKRYGDYMKLPPENQRKFHHHHIGIDFEKSYREYKGKLYCIK